MSFQQVLQKMSKQQASKSPLENIFKLISYMNCWIPASLFHYMKRKRKCKEVNIVHEFQKIAGKFLESWLQKIIHYCCIWSIHQACSFLAKLNFPGSISSTRIDMVPECSSSIHLIFSFSRSFITCSYNLKSKLPFVNFFFHNALRFLLHFRIINEISR